MVLASGLAEGEQRDRLGELVQEGMVSLPDGPTTLRVPAGVLNASGEAPRRPELLAWTALALLELDQPEAAGDLVGELMGGYSGAWGFGAGWGGSMCVVDVENRLTVAYVMNRMLGEGDLRAARVVFAAHGARAAR